MGYLQPNKIFYGIWPWGRPDMAPMIFTKSILNGEKIKYSIMAICLEILLTLMMSLKIYTD